MRGTRPVDNVIRTAFGAEGMTTKDLSWLALPLALPAGITLALVVSSLIPAG